MEKDVPFTKKRSLELKKAMYAAVPVELHPQLDKLYETTNYKNYSPVRRFEEASGITGIYHQYKIPNDMDPLEYEALMKPMRIYELIERGLHKDMDPLVEILQKQKSRYLPAIREMYEALVELNPELKKAKISSSLIRSYVVVISGACSGFPPEDIINFSYARDRENELLNDEKRQFSKLLEQRLGKRGPGNIPLIENWCPSEQTRRRILELLDKKKDEENEWKFFEFLENRGYFDD